LCTSYCQTKEDVEKLKRGLKLCLKIAQTEPLASHLDLNDLRPDLDNELHLRSDADLEAVVRRRVTTTYHPTSTCRMAPLEDGGVVDGKLRVYGTLNLRVCDASIFPSIISGHTASDLGLRGSKQLIVVFSFFPDWRLHSYRREIC
jgi:choline dehydrogenase